MSKLELFTTHYKAFNPESGVPVQTSNGRPKFTLDYPLRYKAQLLYPEWSAVRANLSVEEFNQRYFEVMDSRGLDNVTDILESIAEHAGDNRLVIMCFEKNPRECHRRAFAEWWESKTGEMVPELS